MLRSKGIGEGSRAEVDTLIDAYTEQHSTTQQHTSVGKRRQSMKCE